MADKIGNPLYIDQALVTIHFTTAKFINVDFASQRVVLQAKHFLSSHTNQAWAGVFDDILQTLSILKSSVHVVLRDNAKNTKMPWMMLDSLACNMSLKPSSWLLKRGFWLRNNADAVTVGSNIVGHRKHSTLAYYHLDT